MKALVGYTGFVGSNLMKETSFDSIYNSKNIHEAFGTNPDLLVYAGVRAEMFLANHDPEADYQNIVQAMENISKINPKQIVLISTIAVYESYDGFDESHKIDKNAQTAYGKHRLLLEEYVSSHFTNSIIVRLPALFGDNLKKNFIYDMLHPIPSMLNEVKYKELIQGTSFEVAYKENGNGFYSYDKLFGEKNALLSHLENKGFTALCFTDSRSMYQFYNLKRLWNDIQICIEHSIPLMNLVSEPIQASEIYSFVYGKQFLNALDKPVIEQNLKTKYASVFGGESFICSKDTVVKELKEFVISNQQEYHLSISNLAYNEEWEKDILCRMQELGYKGLEIAPTKIVKENPYDATLQFENYRNNLYSSYGLHISSMQSIWFGKQVNVFTNKEDFDAMIRYTKKAIDLAEKIGCKNLVFGNPKARNIDNDRGYMLAILFFKELGDYAYEHHTCLSIEPNPSIYGTNFLTNTQDAISFIHKVNSHGLKLNYDLGTAIQNEESLSILKDNIHLINHVHISEPYLKKIEHYELVTQLFDILIEKKYSKYVSIEMGLLENKNDVINCMEKVREVSYGSK